MWMNDAGDQIMLKLIGAICKAEAVSPVSATKKALSKLQAGCLCEENLEL